MVDALLDAGAHTNVPDADKVGCCLLKFHSVEFCVNDVPSSRAPRCTVISVAPVTPSFTLLLQVRSALCCAASVGHLGVVKALLRRAARVDSRDLVSAEHLPH